MHPKGAAATPPSPGRNGGVGSAPRPLGGGDWIRIRAGGMRPVPWIPWEGGSPDPASFFKAPGAGLGRGDGEGGGRHPPNQPRPEVPRGGGKLPGTTKMEGKKGNQTTFYQIFPALFHWEARYRAWGWKRRREKRRAHHEELIKFHERSANFEKKFLSGFPRHCKYFLYVFVVRQLETK